MRAWGLPEEFWAQERGEQRSPAEKLWQAIRAQNITHCAADAESPKLHLQHIVDAAHQGEHHQDLRKQELQIIANIKEKCELYLRNIVHSAAAPPRKVRQKTREKHRISRIFDRESVGEIPPTKGSANTSLRTREFPPTKRSAHTEEFEKCCESLSIAQKIRKVFAKFF